MYTWLQSDDLFLTQSLSLSSPDLHLLSGMGGGMKGGGMGMKGGGMGGGMGGMKGGGMGGG